MHRKYGDRTDRYEKAFLKQWNFIEKHLLDPVHGGWYWDTTRDGTLIGDGAKANAWKANYHTSRALMNVVKMLGSPQQPHSECLLSVLVSLQSLPTGVRVALIYYINNIHIY